MIVYTKRSAFINHAKYESRFGGILESFGSCQKLHLSSYENTPPKYIGCPQHCQLFLGYRFLYNYLFCI